MPLIRKDATDTNAAAPVDHTGAMISGNAEQRWNAARTLGEHKDGVDILGRALQVETEERVREAIFTSLVRHGDAASVDAILPLVRSPDANLRTGALDALRAMTAAVRPRLPQLLVDPDPDLRVLVCDLTRELPAADATALLCAVILRDPEPNVCAAAVDILADVGDATALPALARCAERFPEDPFLTFALGIAAERIATQHE